MKSLKKIGTLTNSHEAKELHRQIIVNVELEFDNSLINVVIDRFGKEVTIHSKTETTFHISVEVAPEETFFGWILMFGNKVKIIIGPEAVKGRMKEYLERVMEMYEK